MTLTPILEREITEIVNTRARHALAIEANLLRRAQQFIRRGVLEGEFRPDTARGAMTINRHEAASLFRLGHQHFPRVHPAPGKLPWCLVNTHGPVCDNRAEPGSDFCRAHAHYGDIQDWRRP